MIRRGRGEGGQGEIDPPDPVAAKAHMMHLAMLREARIQHRAITVELRAFYNSVAAEDVPERFRCCLQREVSE